MHGIIGLCDRIDDNVGLCDGINGIIVIFECIDVSIGFG